MSIPPSKKHNRYITQSIGEIIYLENDKFLMKLQKKPLVDAERTLKKLIREDPDNWRFYLYHTIILNKYKIPLKAITSHIKKALRKNKSDNNGKVLTLNIYSILLKESDNLAKAESRLETALTIDADEKYKIITLNLYAITLIEQEKYKEAEEKFKKALEYNPNDALINYNYSILLTYELNKKEEAVSYLEIAFENSKSTPYKRQINGEYKKGNQKKNEINRKELHHKYYEAVALIYRKEKDIKSAVSLLEDFLIEFPKHIKGLKEIINLYEFYKKDYTSAEKYFQILLELQSNDINIHLNWLRHLIRSKQFEKALKECQRLLIDNPDVSELHNCLGNIAKVEENWEEAKEHYDKAFELTKLVNLKAKYLNNIALLILDQPYPEKFDKAIQLCEKATRMNRNFKWAEDTKQKLLEAKKRIEE